MIYRITLPHYSFIEATIDNDDDLLKLMQHPYGGESDDVHGVYRIRIPMLKYEYMEDTVGGTYKQARDRFHDLWTMKEARDNVNIRNQYWAIAKSITATIDPNPPR